MLSCRLWHDLFSSLNLHRLHNQCCSLLQLHNRRMRLLVKWPINSWLVCFFFSLFLFADYGVCLHSSDPSLPFCTTQFEDGKYVLGCNTRPFTTTWSGSDAQTAVIGVVSSALPLSSSAVVPLVTSTTVIQLINSASRTSALVPSLNQSPTSSSALSSPSEPSTLPKKDSISTSRGLIVGVVIGAAAGSIVLLILLFVLYKWWKQRKATFTTNTTQDANDKPHQGNNYSLGPANNEYIEHNNNRNNSHNPSELDEQSHGSTLIGRQQNTLAANGFPPYQPYANTHPYSPQDIQGVAEAPANVPPHAWSSPAISHMTSPTPSNSSLWMVRTPRMAPTGGYVAFTPSSNYSAAGGQPPSSLPQTRFEGRGVGRASELAELEAKEVGSA
jgi:hypothetical protein